MHFLWIVQLLVLILGPLVRMVLRMIGFGFVTYFGINLIIDQARDYIISEIGGAGATVLAILGLMKIDVAINIMLAAVTTRFILSGLNRATDSKRNRVWTKPGDSSGSISA